MPSAREDRGRGTSVLVPSKGLEPPHPCGYMDLNHARLPIPPRWQKVNRMTILADRLSGKNRELHSTEVLETIQTQHQASGRTGLQKLDACRLAFQFRVH